jgi:glutamate racemase
VSPSSPIVVLDSGLGGLTVVRALRAALPEEDVVYFGDTARLPYGSKTAGTVSAYVRQIITYLRPMDPKHVVIACNTATALALPAVRETFPELSVSGVIEPGAKAAVVAAGAKQSPVIGVIATEATVRSKAYERAIHRRRHYARVLQKATPILVPMIEEGRGEDDPLVKLALKQYLLPLVQHGVDVLVLGCTHYPALKRRIAQLLGPKVTVIDSAEQCAQDVARRLGSAGMLRGPAPDVGELGTLRCFVTDDPQRFAKLASRLLGFEVATPTWVCTDELYASGATAAAVPVEVKPESEIETEPVALSIPA